MPIFFMHAFSKFHWTVFPLAVVIAAHTIAAAPQVSEAEGYDFFEKKIRPVLVAECYKCHSADSEKIKGGLLLDTRYGMQQGSDSGKILSARKGSDGKPAKSLLIQTLRHETSDPAQAMPLDKDKLSNEIIADFEKWIKMGAPDPRLGRSRKKGEVKKNEDHWAFKSVANPPVPTPADARHFVQTPVDAFILAKLQEKKLEPAPKADKRDLIRRATYDLTGLPPTPEEVDAFLADQSPKAFEKVVDRLIASPHYGERWGRHWLDIARYADSGGERTGFKGLYVNAWTYRDYVINAMNKDVPYDQFIIQQLAADRLPGVEKDKSTLAALAFLNVGKRFKNKEDFLDDQIDVVTRGFMGITVICARCHDHKFDPIPTDDYYSLHGVFANSTAPAQAPVIEDPEKNPHYKDFLAELAKIDKEVEVYHREEAARLLAGMLEKFGGYLLESRLAANARKGAKGEKFRTEVKGKGLEPDLALLCADWLKNFEGKKHPLLEPWFQFAKLPEDKFAEQAPDVAMSLAADASAADPLIMKAFEGKPPGSIKDVADVYSQVFVELWKEMKLPAYVTREMGMKVDFKVEKTGTTLMDAGMESLRKRLFASDSSLLPENGTMLAVLGKTFTDPETAIRGKVVALEFSHPGAPKRAMSIEDKPKVQESAVLIRGETGNKGPLVPRQFLAFIAGEDRKPFSDGSGRLDLAKAIASRDNPLTARVIVNRAWQWHFGNGIVRTVSDLGMRSEPPSHPELLDWMATWFMENGWSLKKLNKMIVMSGAWQQGSVASENALQTDPINQWLSHFNVRRLDFEEMRDTLVAVGGKLDPTMGGPPVRIAAEPPVKKPKNEPNVDLVQWNPYRRTVYALTDRSAIPGLFNTFNFANPDMSTGERHFTTIPQQALFMMNSPFIAEQVRNLMGRNDFPADGTNEEKVKFLYRVALQRAPTPEELQMADEFLRVNKSLPATEVVAGSEPTSLPAAATEPKPPETTSKPAAKPLNVWERYTQVLLLTNELTFVN